jgi:hypothetical protein
MDPIEKIANLLGEDEFAGAATAPMAGKIVPFVFEHLSQLNDETLKFDKMEGNSILFTVMQDGKTHQYKMTVDYAGSSQPEQVDLGLRAKQMRRGAAQ